MKHLKYLVMSAILLGSLLVIGNQVYAKSLSLPEDALQKNNVQEETLDDEVEVTRGLKQVLVNKYGEKITGNPKYDHGAPDRDVLEEEMIPGVRYYRYVYDDSLTEAENQEQFLRLEHEALEAYLKRQLGGKEIHYLTDDDILDKGYASSEGTFSVMEK